MPPKNPEIAVKFRHGNLNVDFTLMSVVMVVEVRRSAFGPRISSNCLEVSQANGERRSGVAIGFFPRGGGELLLVFLLVDWSATCDTRGALGGKGGGSPPTVSRILKI